MKEFLNKKREGPKETKPEETSFFKDEIKTIAPVDEEHTGKGKVWKNKQRVLMVASRGISNKERVVMNNIMSLIPHSKKECKIERKVAIDQLNEICFNHSCSNCVYFERRKRELIMWVFKSPEGPSLKFQVNSINTLDEPKMMGNCLKYSRPIISFDKSFDNEAETPQLGLIKEMLTHVFNTPRYHPKSKPFHDHIINFYNVNNTVFFRNYQILNDVKDTFKSTDDLDKLQLVEIGPRISLKLIKIFDGVLGGKCLYSNPLYIPPAVVLKRNAMKFKERQIRLMEKEDDLKGKTKDPVDMETKWINNLK